LRRAPRCPERGPVQPCDGAQPLDFHGTQRAERAAGQRTELQFADRDALEPAYLQADAGQQAADLAVLAFTQRDCQQCHAAAAAVEAPVEHAHRLEHRTLRPGARAATLGTQNGVRCGEEHALLQALQVLVRDLAGDGDAVGLGHAMTRMRESRREFTIVGQQHEPGRAHQSDHAGAAFGIVRGADHALRLVQHQIEPRTRAGARERRPVRTRLDGLAVDLDEVTLRPDPAGELAHRPAIDAYAPLEHQHLAVAA
jgi:hypothetical protein